MLTMRSAGIAAVVAVCLQSGFAQAGVSSLISTSSHTDIAFDTVSQTLFISGSDSIQRFNLATQQFLDPIYLGGQTAGLDISPDGRYLAVANSARSVSKNFVDVVDLTTGQSNRIGFNLAFGEGGTYSTAFDGDNGLLVSSAYEGSGWVPLRRVDLATGNTTTLASVRQNSMLSASADRSVIGVVEANISSGPWGLYQSGASTYSASGGTGWFTYEIGVSRDGSQVAIPTYGGTFIEDADKVIPAIGTYAAGQPVGVAYSPNADLVFFPWAGSTFVYMYDTNTGKRLEGFDFEQTFGTNGNWAYGAGRAKVASDGSYLFVTTPTGVRYMSLSAVPEPTTISMTVLGMAGLLVAASRHRRRT